MYINPPKHYPPLWFSVYKPTPNNSTIIGVKLDVQLFIEVHTKHVKIGESTPNREELENGSHSLFFAPIVFLKSAYLWLMNDPVFLFPKDQ